MVALAEKEVDISRGGSRWRAATVGKKGALARFHGRGLRRRRGEISLRGRCKKRKNFVGEGKAFNGKKNHWWGVERRKAGGAS